MPERCGQEYLTYREADHCERQHIVTDAIEGLRADLATTPDPVKETKRG